MTILVAILAFVVMIAPITTLVSSAANVATATDRITTDVHTWRIDGCPQRQFDGTIHYLCAKKPPVVKKKLKDPNPQMAPQPPVYVPPPLPTDRPGPAPDLKLPVPDGWWTFEHLYAAFIGLIALGVIGHGLRVIYRTWKGLD